jgi:four helix bundle protein
LKEARRLAKEIHLIAVETDLKNDFRFRDQKASSGSVMDNIAEGFERNGNLEFRQFCLLLKVCWRNKIAIIPRTRLQLYRRC